MYVRAAIFNFYPGGIAYLNTTPNPNTDLVFSEGVGAVPEPSTFALVGAFVALGLFRTVVRRRKQNL